LRTAWYQRHFTEIWDKYEALKKDKTPACAATRTKVMYERDSKHRIRHEPARGIEPRHVDGRAIDISYRQIGLSVADLDARADTCGLYRRVATDKHHYEVKP
jgi:hypothetical protein